MFPPLVSGNCGKLFPLIVSRPVCCLVHSTLLVYLLHSKVSAIPNYLKKVAGLLKLAGPLFAKSSVHWNGVEFSGVTRGLS